MRNQVVGFISFAVTRPVFALQMLRCRADHFFHRDVRHPCIDPAGYHIDSPEKLFTWWALFVEQQLFDPAWTKTLAQTVSPQIIDIGANAGVFIHLVLSLNRTAQITAVEPQPELVQLIEKYAQQKRVNIRCVRAACSDHEGEATLHLAKKGDVRASLNANFADHSQQLRVPVTTVDAIAPKGEVFMLKVDAEGHDIEVLKGASATLPRTRFVLVECHTGEMLAQADALLKGFVRRQVGPHDYLFCSQTL